MLTLYIIRHTESTANKDKIIASQTDYPLTKKGLKDAKLIARKLKNLVEINMIFSSPLKRAVQTAEAFSKIYKTDIIPDDRISEQNLGIFSGMKVNEVIKHNNYEHNRQNRWNWIPEGEGESYKMIYKRLIPFFKELHNYDDKINILIVTHAITMRILKAVLENTIPVYSIHVPENGEIWNVEFYKLNHSHKINKVNLI